VLVLLASGVPSTRTVGAGNGEAPPAPSSEAPHQYPEVVVGVTVSPGVTVCEPIEIAGF
jgi:hypothetical protein